MNDSSRAEIPRVALIGVGGYGACHLRWLKALAAQGLVQLVAIGDPAPERELETFQQFTATGGRWYRSYLSLLSEEPLLDLIVICTPIPLHEEMTHAALKLTNAAIYLEKPSVPTLPQLHALIAADPTQRVHVGFQMLGWGAFVRMKEWIVGGRLGAIRQITAGAVWPRDDRYYRRANWAGRMVTNVGQPVFDGPATNALSHLVQMIMYLAGDVKFARPTEVRGEFYRARSIESYDAACVAGSFDSSVKYALSVAHCSRDSYPFTIRVVGDHASAQITMDGRQIEADFVDAEVFGDPEQTDLYKNTILGLCTRQPPTNSLTDCLGYTETTCAGLVSSGRIHKLAEEFVEIRDSFHHVRDIIRATEQTVATGKLWSEQDIPWAQAPASVIRGDSFSSLPFRWMEPTYGSAAALTGDGEVVSQGTLTTGSLSNP